MRGQAQIYTRRLEVQHPGNAASGSTVSQTLVEARDWLRRVVIANASVTNLFLAKQRFTRQERSGFSPSGFFYTLPAGFEDFFIVPPGGAIYALGFATVIVQVQTFPIESLHDMMGTLF